MHFFFVSETRSHTLCCVYQAHTHCKQAVQWMLFLQLGLLLPQPWFPICLGNFYALKANTGVCYKEPAQTTVPEDRCKFAGSAIYLPDFWRVAEFYSPGVMIMIKVLLLLKSRVKQMEEPL